MLSTRLTLALASLGLWLWMGCQGTVARAPDMEATVQARVEATIVAGSTVSVAASSPDTLTPEARPEQDGLIIVNDPAELNLTIQDFPDELRRHGGWRESWREDAEAGHTVSFSRRVTNVNVTSKIRVFLNQTDAVEEFARIHSEATKERSVGNPEVGDESFSYVDPLQSRTRATVHFRIQNVLATVIYHTPRLYSVEGESREIARKLESKITRIWRLSPQGSEQAELPPATPRPLPDPLINPANAGLAARATAIARQAVQYIGNFSANVEGSTVKARFSLFDGSKEYISADGRAMVRIVSSEGDVVYEGTTDVRQEHFREYMIILTGEEALYYVWDIPFSAVEKSPSPLGIASGTMYLTFITENDAFEELETPVFGLPTYSRSELQQMADEEYFKSATDVNETIRKGTLEATVMTAGFTGKLFRVDLVFRNVGEVSTYAPGSMTVLDAHGDQYDSTYGGTLDVGQLYPGARKSGYILFQGVPKSATSLTLLFQGYSDIFNPYVFEYTIELNSPP